MLYQKFGNNPFVTREMEEIIFGSHFTKCRRLKYFQRISRSEAEALRPEIKDWHTASWKFQRISSIGLEMARKIEDNYHLVAKKILIDTQRGSTYYNHGSYS